MENNEDKLVESNEGKFITLVVNEAGYKTLSNKMNDNRKPYEPIDPSKIRAFMPGNVPEIFVKEGDEVKEGDRLLILEAMKMKNVLLAPFDGSIKAINVKLGEIIPKNFVLLELKK
jgi:biotin carboxyl carrier protein